MPHIDSMISQSILLVHSARSLLSAIILSKFFGILKEPNPTISDPFIIVIEIIDVSSTRPTCKLDCGYVVASADPISLSMAGISATTVR